MDNIEQQTLNYDLFLLYEDLFPLENIVFRAILVSQSGLKSPINNNGTLVGGYKYGITFNSLISGLILVSWQTFGRYLKPMLIQG